MCGTTRDTRCSRRVTDHRDSTYMTRFTTRERHLYNELQKSHIRTDCIYGPDLINGNDAKIGGLVVYLQEIADYVGCSVGNVILFSYYIVTRLLSLGFVGHDGNLWPEEISIFYSIQILRFYS